MKNDNPQLEKVKEVVDHALSIPTSIYWDFEEMLDVSQLWRLYGSRGYASFRNIHAFTDFLKFNSHELNIVDTIRITSKSPANKFLRAEQTLKEYDSHLVEKTQAQPDDFVLRTKYGTRPVAFYHSLSKTAINAIKTAYANIQFIKYFDVRPCLFKNWITWDEDRQQQSCFD